MSRRRKRLVAIAVLLLGLPLAAIVRAQFGSHSPTANPGVALQFVGFTNVEGKWSAQMVLTNRSGHLQFVHALGDDPDYWGRAKVPNATYPLTGDHFGVLEHDLALLEGRDFLVNLPKHTQSW